MKFAIITHAIHKKKTNQIFAYEPYVREINLWTKYVDEVKIISPFSESTISPIEEKYTHKKTTVLKIPSFDILNFKNKIKAIFIIPIIFIRIFKVMYWADHIHLRCPGNIGLLGCLVQICFPFKQKTIKYAGNWDPKSKQPLTYKLQKWIVSNTFLTRNCKVLVYGDWDNQSKNIMPFYTASYKTSEIEKTPLKKLDKKIHFMYVGTFSKGKQPLVSVKTIEILLDQNYNVQLDMYGEGEQFDLVKNYIENKKLSDSIILHRNQPKEIVKKAYQKSHFLIFISLSEGWPKVVAEAMFWRCLPISSKVSCVDYMLGFGKRGTVTSPNIKETELTKIIKDYLKDSVNYQNKVREAQKWSQNITLDTFENEIKKLLIDE